MGRLISYQKLFRYKILCIVLAAGLLTGLATACNGGQEEEEFLFGMVMVGPFDDQGWSEAHYVAGQYVEGKLAGAKMIWIDKVNPADRPDTTLEETVDDLVHQGAKLIFTTSDEYASGTDVVAKKYRDVTFINISGDHVLTGAAPSNVGNLMGRIEFMEAGAGCAAALNTETGTLGYLGPLINHETRRIAAAAYLGARYCYENYRGLDPNGLRFLVTWIGFWFHIPGQTLDPSTVTNDLFNDGADVVLSGLDTKEAVTVAEQRATQGERVFAIPHMFKGACTDASQVCLGVPYINWGPSYLKVAEQVREGSWEPSWEWVGPDWADINSQDTSAVGFNFGPALSGDQKARLDEFIAELSSGNFVIFKGPLKFQDGATFLVSGQTATDDQVWYLPKLLEGMEGPSE